MATIDQIVVVTVTKTTATVSRVGFGTPIGVFQIPIAVQPTRFATYSSRQALLDAGALATDAWVLWAGIVFSQQPAPDLIAIGRRTPGTAQVDTVTITTPDVPGSTWSVTIDGVVFAYIEQTGDAAQDIAVGLRASIDAGDVPVVTALPVAGVFTVTANVAGETFLNGGIVVPGAGAGTFINTTPNGAAEAMATALAAINAENSKDWYVMTIETRNDADITALATFIGAEKKIAVVQSSDADAKAGTPVNIFDTIQATNNKRITMLWHDDDREYLDGGAAAILAAADLDAVNGQITLHGKQVIGVPVDDLTDAEVANIAGDKDTTDGFGGNVHVDLGGRGFILFGKSSEGEFTDVQTTLDWTEFRTQEAVFGKIATTPNKIPYTAAGIAQITNEVRGVLNTGVTNGHFSGDFPPTVTAPAIEDISTADKNARILRNVVGEAKLAGAIHSVLVQVNVTV